MSSDLLQMAVLELEGQTGDIKKAGLVNLLTGEIRRIREEIKKLQDGYFPGPFTTHTLQ